MQFFFHKNILNINNVSLTINNCLFQGNSVPGFGSGLYAQYIASNIIKLNRLQFYNNLNNIWSMHKHVLA